jgi:predicted small secreted protein
MDLEWYAVKLAPVARDCKGAGPQGNVRFEKNDVRGHHREKTQMKRNRRVLTLVVALGASILAGCATTSAPRGAAEWDGLVRQPATRLDAVFLKPGAQIGAFESVLLDPVSISFASNWDPTRGTRGVGQLNAADIAGIKEDLAALFQETFRAELGRGGFKLVDEPGPRTLRATAAIIDLFVTAPDTMSPGRTRVYTTNTGRMTLVIELRDSVTGEILARAVDQQSGRGSGMWMVTNSVMNTADARRAIGVWASSLRRALEDVYPQAR